MFTQSFLPQRPPQGSPCPAGAPERSSSHEPPPPEAGERGVGAQDAPGPRRGAAPCVRAPRLTCPRRIRQPLDGSHQAPLEKFPNFFAALHALAPSRPNKSQKEETATARAPGLCVHHRCPRRSFPRSGLHSPRAPCVAGAGKRSAVAVPKRCKLAAGVPGPFWDTGFTWGHLAFSRGAPRLRHQSSRAERREVSLSGGGELALNQGGKGLEPHGAGEHPALATAAVAAGSASSSQPGTRPPAVLRGQAPPLHVPPRDQPPPPRHAPGARPPAAPAFPCQRGPTQDRPPSGPAWIEETNK